MKQQHTTKYFNANVEVQNFIQKSITFQKDYLSFQLDGMDNSKSILPRLLEKSKNMTFEQRLPCKITGCITTSSMYPNNRNIQFYVNHGKQEKSYLVKSMSQFLWDWIAL